MRRFVRLPTSQLIILALTVIGSALLGVLLAASAYAEDMTVCNIRMADKLPNEQRWIGVDVSAPFLTSQGYTYLGTEWSTPIAQAANPYCNVTIVSAYSDVTEVYCSGGGGNCKIKAKVEVFDPDENGEVIYCRTSKSFSCQQPEGGWGN